MPRARFRCLALAMCWLAWLRSGTAFAEQASSPAGLGDPSLDAEPAPGLEPHVPLHDVVLLAPPELLERAVRAALLPWGMRIESVVRDAPTPTLPGAAWRAGALARELDAKALVWLSSNADGAALWVYEATKNTIVARPIPDAPLDRALAAALALSVKTWLRSSEQNPQPASPVVEVPVMPAPLAPVAPAAPPPAAPPNSDGPPPSPETARWQIAIHAGARRGAFEQSSFEPRYGLELRMSPWQSSGATRSILAARVEIGAAQGIRSSTFQGVYSEFAAGVSLGLAHRLAEALGVAFHIGATVHRGSVWGTLPNQIAAEGAEWGAAAQLRPEAELSFGSIGILAQPTIGLSILGERYEVREVVVLETRPVWWMLGGALRAELF
jgi:hypothetical protein